MIRFVAVLLLALSTSALAQTSISPLDCVAPFYHGVASGDPLQDRVIIWTRVTPLDFNTPVVVEYKVATDTNMLNVVSSGAVLTDAQKDFTVKVDVTGLNADSYYFYEFTALQAHSARGRTKTAPSGSIDSLRFALVSCANLEAGYFNVYEALSHRNDFEAVLMLGDYIYEYETGGYSPNSSIDRIFEPSNEIITINDYRLRYSVYHMDKNLQKLHQNFPWICVWDDHESANDSFEGGAENHNAGEGFWSDRKLFAQKAYFEWLPIREKAPGNVEIFRTFNYGNLVDLFMVDTRLNGRQEQGVNESDPNRTMLGVDQYNWLIDELDNSSAQWKIMGNQVVFAPITVFGIPINEDAWDGYPAERQKVLNHLTTNDIDNFVVLTGDIHTSWAFNIKNGSDARGVEFVTPSVTSPGSPVDVGGILQIENPHIKYVELTKRGYVMLDINTQRVQGDWYYINTIDDFNNPAETWGTSYYSNSGQNQLNSTTTVSFAGRQYDMYLAPQCPRSYEVGLQVEEISPEIIAIYPVPVNEELTVQFAAIQSGIHQLEVISSEGRSIRSQNSSVVLGIAQVCKIDLSDLESGMYLLRMTDPSGVITQRSFIKN